MNFGGFLKGGSRNDILGRAEWICEINPIDALPRAFEMQAAPEKAPLALWIIHTALHPATERQHTTWRTLKATCNIQAGFGFE